MDLSDGHSLVALLAVDFVSEKSAPSSKQGKSKKIKVMCLLAKNMKTSGRGVGTDSARVDRVYRGLCFCVVCLFVRQRMLCFRLDAFVEQEFYGEKLLPVWCLRLFCTIEDRCLLSDVT